MTLTTLVAYDEVAGPLRPGVRPRDPRRAGDRDQAVLRLLDRLLAPRPTRTSARSGLGLPGSLPVTNEKAIEFTIRIGLALHCEIAAWCRFARKNYFYPDMPKDYQVSQYDEPLCFDGYLDVTVDGQTYRVDIERVHLEEDTGKSLHVGGVLTGRIHGATHSLVDYNRAGIPLVEIVTRAGGRDRRQGRRRARRPTSPSCATCCAASRSPTSGWSRAACCAATSTCR